MLSALEISKNKHNFKKAGLSESGLNLLKLSRWVIQPYL